MQNSVCRQRVTVNLEIGLHLRPISQIAKVARQHQSCDIRILKEDMSVDAKNILELMTLNAPHGTELTLEATGETASRAVEELSHLFTSNFEDEPPSGSPST